MQTLSKKQTGYFLGALLAVLLMAPALLGFSHNVHAASGALSGDQLFGGTDANSGEGAAFAGSSGLGSADLTDTIASIIRVALGFLGIVAVVIILLGGFKWMTSGGAEDKVKSAKKLIYSGIIGLVIVLSAYAIASFVIGSISTATTTAGNG